MQTIAQNPPATPQHVPDGWGYPQPQQHVQLVPMPGMPGPAQQPGAVTGGGAAPVATGTVTRMRWGRILPVLAGIGLLAFGVWTATSNPGSAGGSRTVAGGGGSSPKLEVADSGSDVQAPPKGGANAPTRSVGGGGAGASTAQAKREAAAAAATRRAAAQRTAAAQRKAAADRRAAAQRRARNARRTTVGGGTANAFATASAGAAGDRAAARRRAARSGELPMTGLSTWIAAILGALLLTAGILVQVNAVRLGARAMLYRRGILLRPTDCAALIAERGSLARVRVLVSNALDRLLEEPAERAGQFVSARHAR